MTVMITLRVHTREFPCILVIYVIPSRWCRSNWTVSTLETWWSGDIERSYVYLYICNSRVKIFFRIDLGMNKFACDVRFLRFFKTDAILFYLRSKFHSYPHSVLGSNKIKNSFESETIIFILPGWNSGDSVAHSIETRYKHLFIYQKRKKRGRSFRSGGGWKGWNSIFQSDH